MSRDALVVGISAYPTLPSLGAPGRDAEAIAQCLQAYGDFRVTRMPEIVQAGQSKVGLKTPVTLAELEAALVRLFKPKGNNIPQTALFYYSGHGLQKDAGIQEGYLATSDANPHQGIYGLSLFWLRRLLQESPVRQRILLLDCCHSGEILNFLEADPGAKSGTDRLFMAAAREYEAAYEAIAGDYSVFTQALLDGLNPERLSSGNITNYALTDWVSNALKGEMQQPLFENSGSEILLTRCQGVPTLVQAELTQEICPYRGLEYFDEVHAGYFFGREDLTDQLIEKLKTRNFVAVVGASGSGKSSLVRAGLIHKLRQGQKFSGCDRWRIQLITPTEQPLKSLASAFVNPNAPAVERAEQLRRAETFLRDGGAGLGHLVRGSLMSAKQGRNSRLLLIIDQFEEVFTLCQGPQAERERHRFFNCLVTAMKHIDDCFSVVIVLRADFFGKCSLYNGLAEQIEQNLVTVTPLTYEQIKASVVKPAQKVGLVCEPNLIYNILLDVVGAPGELPLLQYTLLELWQRRQSAPDGGAARLTLDAYTELGGVRGTLQKRADEIFYSLTPEEQRVAKRIFIALTQLGDGTEDTRRRILKSELISPRYPAELVERVLEKLVRAKLVITNRVLPTSRYQEHIDQGLANMSTALRLAQLRRGKLPKHLPAENLSPSHPTERPIVPSQLSHINGITRLPAAHLADLKTPAAKNVLYQETVDVAHETLIRNWSLLRTWLDENRELLRRQRRIEQAAREWCHANQPRSTEYLLTGDRLLDAEDFLNTYPDDLSVLAQRYVTISREERRRSQKELRLLQMAVPCTLLGALMVTFNQYQAAMKSQAEKDYQAQVATSRQRAAIAQSILQEPNGDPTTALLISRLAAEQGGFTYEAQASLRAALQKLRLQASFQGHQGAVQQVVFSPNQPQLATAGSDGTIRLWSLTTRQELRVLDWKTSSGEQKAAGDAPETTAARLRQIALSSDGRQLAAIAETADHVRVWSVESGALQFKLGGFRQAVTTLALSRGGDAIAAASADKTVRIWRSTTGELLTQQTLPNLITSLAFSPDGRSLLIASGQVVQLLQAGRVQKRLRHSAWVTRAQFSPDGSTIATGSADGGVRVWSAKTGHLQQQWQVQPAATSGSAQRSQAVIQVQFSPNGKMLAAQATDRQVSIWNLESEQLQMQTAVQPDEASSEAAMTQGTFVFSPDSRQLATVQPIQEEARLSHMVQLWEVSTGDLSDRFRAHGEPITAVQFSPDGSLLATASADGSTRLWATTTGGELPAVNLAGQSVQWAAFRRSGDGLNVPSATPTATVATLSDRANQVLRPPGEANRLSQQPGLAPLGRSAVDEVVTLTATGNLHRVSLQAAALSPLVAPPNLAPEATSPWQTRAVNLFTRMGETVWSLKARSPWQMLNPGTARPELTEQIPRVSPAPAGSPAAGSPVAGNPPATTTLTHRDSNITRLAAKLLPGARLTSTALRPDSQQIATADSLGMVTVWQIQPNFTVQRLRQWTVRTAPATSAKPKPAATPIVRQLAFSPDGQLLLGVGEDGSVSIWNLGTGNLISQLAPPAAIVTTAEFSPDAQLIVSTSPDQIARVWRVASSELLTVIEHPNGVNSAHFSPDGLVVATTSSDGIARVVDAKTGALRVVLAGHRGSVLDAEFSPDGQMLVTASEDGTARLWDAKTGTERTILRPIEQTDPPEPLQQAFFSPDGRFVATLSKSGQMRLWIATWDGLLNLARDRSLRQLKSDECLRYLGLLPAACPTLPDAN